MTLCEVWGAPIAHSKSPVLHRAAYGVLGWDWTYERREVDEASFPRAVADLPPELRGLSLTMPLKAVARAYADQVDGPAQLTGSVNTLLWADGVRGFNTDVAGLATALREAGAGAGGRIRVLGAGATAASAVVAAADIGAKEVRIAARRPEAAQALASMGQALPAAVVVEDLARVTHDVDLTISTLPVSAAIDPESMARLADAGGWLYDVTYGHWPSPAATVWERAGHAAHSGLGMLLHQAVVQLRIFSTGCATEALDDEPAVVAAMRRAVMGD